MTKLKSLEGKEVVLYLHNGQHIYTYIRTTFQFIGMLEILRPEAVKRIINYPSDKEIVLSNSTNFKFISAKDIRDAEKASLTDH